MTKHLSTFDQPMPLDWKPSKLGTKEHWDSVYKDELSNFKEIGDEGEVWFGTESVEKMVDWALKYVPPNANPSILEVGSGNGALLFALVESGYIPQTITGIDYSPDAIQLARAIANSKGHDSVRFEHCDFLNDPVPPPPPNTEERWNLLLDKGTFDAIALAVEDENGRSPAERYPARVASLLKDGGLFLITSCNFTEEELKTIFVHPNIGLVYHSRVQHRTYTFGGRSGTMYATVAFQRTPSSDP